MIARQLIESALAATDGKLVLLVLGWSRAFDSVGLVVALARFGISDRYCKMIRAIYCNRPFVVQDAGLRADRHDQYFGISQGCPLPPFLFSILMTVVLHDASG